MRRIFFLHAVMAIVSLCIVSNAKAAVCASTFGPGSSFGGPVYSAQGSGAGPRVEWAFSFTPSVDCRLGTSEVAFHLTSGTNALRISVVEDASGVPSSTVVESTTVIGQLTTDVAGSIVTGTFTGANVLGGSSTYWIVVEAEPVTGDTLAVWHASPTTFGPRAVRFNAASWMVTGGVQGAFRIAEPIPVPGLTIWGLGLLGTVLVLLAGLLLVGRHTQESAAL